MKKMGTNILLFRYLASGPLNSFISFLLINENFKVVKVK
jgi:hypothetical protein